MLFELKWIHWPNYADEDATKKVRGGAVKKILYLIIGSSVFCSNVDLRQMAIGHMTT